MRLRASFPKVRRSWSPPLATFRWDDGLVATTPQWGPADDDRLPHDLGHYLTEAWFRPRYGFWSLTAEQVPFSSLTLVHGRWPHAAHARLDRLVRKHGTDMLKAEATDLSALIDTSVDVDAQWPRIRRMLERAYVFNDDNPFAGTTPLDLKRFANRGRALRNCWRRVPVGGALEVAWPPTEAPRIVGT